MWCPTRGVSIWPSETRHAQHEKCGWLKEGRKGARYARIAAGDLRRCPPPFSQPLCSAMSSMHRCCSSELKRRKESHAGERPAGIDRLAEGQSQQGVGGNLLNRVPPRNRFLSETNRHAICARALS